MNSFTWSSQVRPHEVDAQGIVYNAHYLSYFDNARSLHMLESGVNWVELSKEDFNLVLIHCDIHFKKPLRAFQLFHVTSQMERQGKLKLIFNQSIISDDGTTMCESINTIVCLDVKRNKPIPIDKVKNGLFSHIK